MKISDQDYSLSNIPSALSSVRHVECRAGRAVRVGGLGIHGPDRTVVAVAVAFLVELQKERVNDLIR